MKIQKIYSANYKSAINKDTSFKSSVFSQFDQINSTNPRSAAINPKEVPVPTRSNSINSAISTQPIGNSKKPPITFIIAAGVMIVGIGVLVFKAKKGGFKNSNINKLNSNIDKGLDLLKTNYSKIIEKFPEDKRYYEKLAGEVGLKNGEEYKLTSIIGSKQLEHLFENFTPQDFKVGEKFEGVKNLTYRVNLHNHTQDSDGTLSVKDILDQVRKLADKIAEKVQDNKPAFTIAITDHDSLDGAKEAVKIISENPAKFKNLRVVLGSELSLVHTSPSDVNVPLNYEILGYSINPFDPKLNKYLTGLRNSRINVMKKILEDANGKYPEYNFNWDEARQCGNNLGKALSNGFIYNLRDYMAFKNGLCEFGNDNSITNVISNYGRDFIESSAFKKVDGPYIENYLKTSGILKGSDATTAKIKPDFLNYIDKIRDSYVKNPQKLVDTNVVTTADKFFKDAVDMNSEGFFGLAHPGLVAVSNGEDYGRELQEYCSKKHIDWKECLFERFLKKTIVDSNGNLKAAEINYQSYGQQYQGFENYLQYIKNTISSSEQKLFNAGGVDCHANNLFKEKQQLTDKELTEIFKE